MLKKSTSVKRKKRETKKRIKIALIERELREMDLAKRLGVSKAYISMIIKGTRQAHRLRPKIAKILHKKVSEL